MTNDFLQLSRLSLTIIRTQNHDPNSTISQLPCQADHYEAEKLQSYVESI